MNETLEDKFFHHCQNKTDSCENCQYRDSGDLVNCALNYGYQQGIADALSIDMDKPMHFTDEQKAWIKNYIIINAKRHRADAIEEYMNKLCDKCIQSPNECYNLECPFADDVCRIITVSEQLKEQKK